MVRLICSYFLMLGCLVGAETAPTPEANAAQVTATADKVAAVVVPAPAVEPVAAEATDPAAEPAPVAVEAETEGGADKAAVATAPTVVEKTPAPVFATAVIANELARFTISAQRGGVAKMELIKERPVKLPPTLRKRLGDNAPDDLDEPLALLDDFRGNTTSTHYNLHNLITLANPTGPNIDGTADEPWTFVDQTPVSVGCVLDLPERGLKLRLDYVMGENRPSVDVKWTITNTSGDTVSVDPRVYPVNGIHQDYGPGESYYLAAAGHTGGEDGKIFSESVPSDPGAETEIGGQELDYAAVKSRFFAALWQSRSAAAVQAVAQVEGQGQPKRDDAGMSAPMAGPSGSEGDDEAVGYKVVVQGYERDYIQPFLRVDYPTVVLPAHAEHQIAWRLTGTSMAQDSLEYLTKAEQRIEYTDAFYRFFKSLANILAWCLSMIALVVQNYGVALIILTFLIKLALHRTTFKQQSSMLKMQKLAPELKLLQERYKNDRAQLGAKTMEMYKKHGVNPLGGCLPIFIQMPMFMALYQVFTHSADFRGTSFLWISDLTLEDAIWGLNYPYFTWLTINPLALIYIGVTLWMSFQYKTPPNADAQQAQMQKMMRYMPLLFGLMFYHMPAGLVLYFTVNAILSTIEMKMVKRKLGMD